jgi:hypothetical protein
MNPFTQHETEIETSRTVNSAPAHTRSRHLFTIEKFANKYCNFLTKSSLTNQLFKAQTRHSSKGEITGNGMLDFGVIIRIGRKVLINEDAYFRWLDAQQESRSAMSLHHSQEIVNSEGELYATETGAKRVKS